VVGARNGVAWACRRGGGSSVVGFSVGFAIEARNGVACACRRGGGSSVVGFSGGHPSVPISAWTRETHPTPRPSLARARSLPVWRSPIRADLGLASPNSPNEFGLAKKWSPEVELGLKVVEPCRLVAEKILVAEINLTVDYFWLVAVCLVGC
jgi:hypothetical protein